MFLKNYSKPHLSMTSNSIFYQARLIFHLPFQSRYIFFFQMLEMSYAYLIFQLCRCVIDNMEDLLSLAATIRELLDHKVISRCPSS